ncbi:hypothetical protein AU210_011136 [Fusarium oxysporum f. sp. radicis-cucumerinum]|uniref:FluG domain-containing protein n=1 Tax=Fusarium oxysporum f. sp. radicis-cucumerinum TaxID=327505 RepID=A0A2H3GCF3_FUSOX|nr:hypothetical protein AU210_011136 [Fusarium oxysporum f. sp. radicis-cucumerinum]
MMTAPRSAAAGGLHKNNAVFLQSFAVQEAKRRAAKQKPTLSIEEHAAHRAQLTDVLFIKPKYSGETEINISGIFRKWLRYCTDLEVGDWKATIQNLKRETTQDFVLYMCERYNITSWGSIEEYIRQFQQLYTTVNGRYMDRNHSKEVYKYYRRVCIPRFGHRPPNIDGKPVLNVDNLRVILTFNIAFDTSIFPGERHRISLAGCYQLLCYTGARPAELVDGERKKPKDNSLDELFGHKTSHSSSMENGTDPELSSNEKANLVEGLLTQETMGRGRPKALCYEDILMMIVRHPVTGRCIPAMAIKFIHHKGADNKPRPTIFFFTPTRKLLFCAVSTILALALHDDAFDAPSLTTASAIFGSRPPSYMVCTPLRWKASKLKIPVFRRYRGANLSEDEAMLYSKLRDDIGDQSLNSGHERRWTPRFARRGASNAANGDAPDSVRDQMMRHDPQFATFHHAYLNEIANFDLQNAFLEEEKQSQLFRLFAHVSLTRDPRATADMVPEEVWASLPPDPEIVKLEEERAELKEGNYRIDGHIHEEKIRQLTQEIRKKRSQRDRQVVKQYREHYFYNRPTWDIERQAQGEEEEEFSEPIINVTIPERARLGEIFCHQPDDLTEDQIFQLKIETVDLMVALCDKRETIKRNCIKERVKAYPFVKTEPLEIEYETPPIPNRFPLLLHAAQCPDCIGDERLSCEERTFTYCRPTVMNDHFDDQHLTKREQAERSGEKIRCEHPKCRDLKFQHINHFRNHVQKVHGVTLRSSEQVQQRRQRKERRRQMVRKQGLLVS